MPASLKEKSVLVGLKYCGGCQARYDRMAALQTIKDSSPDGTIFEPVREGKVYDYILIINGCQAQCANIKNLKSTGGYYSLFQFSSPAEAAVEIRHIGERKRQNGKEYCYKRTNETLAAETI